MGEQIDGVYKRNLYFLLAVVFALGLAIGRLLTWLTK